MSTDEARQADKLIGRQIGDFVVEERIGEGSFGAVYRARQPRLGRLASLKVLHTRLSTTAEATERFLREARTASSLDHPYGAHIYASGAEPDGTLWIAMEYVRGVPFSDYLRENGPLPLERFVPFFERVCEVVHSAHQEGIVHRDIKPANIMVLSRSGRLLPKLLDFGVAKAIEATARERSAAGEKSRPGRPREQQSLVETAPPDPAAVTLGTGLGDGGGRRSSAEGGDQGADGPHERPSPAETAPADRGPAARETGAERVERTGRGARGGAEAKSSPAEEQRSSIELAGTAAGAAAPPASTHASGGSLDLAATAGGQSSETPGAAEPAPSGPRRDQSDGRPWGSGSSDVTQHGQLVGSPFYMAPEQWDDAAAVDARSDIYALGILAYEALTAKRPFSGESLEEVARAHRERPPPPVPEALPPELNGLFQKALAKRPDERFESALALAEGLRGASGLSEDTAPAPGLEADIRDQFLDGAPRPLADALATLDLAKELRQARDALWSAADVLAHYLGLLALGAHSRFGRSLPQAAADILRRSGVDILSSQDWLALAEALCEPYAEHSDLHPTPELVELFWPGDEEARGKRLFEATWAFRDVLSSPQLSEREFRDKLEKAISELSELLRRSAFVCDYPLALPGEAGEAEMLIGLSRARERTPPQRAPIRSPGSSNTPFRAHAVYLLDADRAPVLCLHPLLQVEPPAPETPPQLFLFAGGSPRGAKLVAAPLTFERHDDKILEWLRLELGASFDPTQEHVDKERAPYLGLEAFTASDADLFVGREDEIDTFTNRLRVDPFLAVVGPSGAGKSSFIQAGVLPALKERKRDLRAIVLRPGAAPISALAARLAAAGVPSADLEVRLRDDPGLLGELLRGEVDGRGEIALVVDQFEELFTLTTSEEERDLFAEALARAARSKTDPIRVILSLRDDFLVRAEGLPALQSRLSHALLLLTAPGADQLERIVREPARRAGYEFEDPDLPARMVAEVAGEPGALALLSFTAAMLWDARDRHFRRIPTLAYDDMGGVGGALAHHADALLDSMPAGQRRHVREAFRLLVTSEGTRSVLGRGELLGALGGSPEAEAALERLVKARLLVISEGEEGEKIEVAHETLLTSWPRLVQWRREDAESARLRDQLRAAAVQWDRRGRPKGLLWHGDALAEYRLWRARYPGALTQIEEDFGRASLAAAKRTRRRRQALTTGAFAILATGVAVLFVMSQRAEEARGVAEEQRAVAEEQRAVAEDRQAQIRTQLLESYLEQGSKALRGHDYFRALLFLTEAYEMGSRGAEVESMLSLAAAPLEGRIAARTKDAQLQDVRFSPDDRRIAATTKEGPVFVLDAENLEVIHTLTGHEDSVWAAAWSPQGELLATGGADGRVILWDPESGSELRSREHDGREVTALGYDSAGARLVAGSDDGSVRIYDRTGDELLRDPWEAHPIEDGGFVMTLDIAPDDGRVATGGGDGRVRLWDLETGELARALSRYDGPVDSVVFSSTGERLASTSRDGTAQLVHGETGELVMELDRHDDRVYTARFSPNGELLATAGEDETVQLWDGETGSHLASLEGHEGYVSYVDFHPDGDEIITGGADGDARRWDAHTGSLIGLLPVDTQRLTAARYSADGSVILIGGMYGPVTLWNAESTPVRILHEHDGRVVTARYSDEAPRLLTVGHDGTAHIREGDEARIAHTIAHPSPLSGGDINRDGDAVALLDTGGEIAVWTPGESAPDSVIDPEGHVPTLRFSPDGRELFVGGPDPAVWNVSAGSRQSGPATRERLITSGDFGGGGDRLITGSDDGLVELFQLGERAPSQNIGRQGDWITGVAVSPEHDLVATSSQDGTIRLWDAERGGEVATLEGHDGWVWDVAFGRGGDILASAGADSTVRLWSVDSGRQIAQFEGHHRVVRSVSFSADGSALASGSEDSTARIWRIPSRAWDAEKVREVARCLPLTLIDSNPAPRSDLPESC